MTKTIHIHKKTQDAGTFKEDQHKRDKGGQFTTSSGAGGGYSKGQEVHMSHPQASRQTTRAGVQIPSTTWSLTHGLHKHIKRQSNSTPRLETQTQQPTMQVSQPGMSKKRTALKLNKHHA